jgi:hypothetical protein
LYKNKLIKHLKSLKRKEFTRFTQFANSPYYNKHKDIITLVKYLDKLYPNFTEYNCKRNILLDKCFDKKLNQKQLAVVFTYTYNLLHKFYRTEAFQENEEEQDLLFLDKLKNLNEKNLFYEVLDKRLNNTLGSFNNYRLAKIRESYENSLGSISSQEQFLKKQSYLDHYYLLEKIHEICEGITLSRITKESYPLKHEEALLNLIRKEVQNSNDLKTFYTTYETITGKIEFTDGLNGIQEMESNLKIVKLKEIYNILQNYCIFKINQGESDFLMHAFSIYKAQLLRELLFVEGILPEGHYKNITTIALRAKSYDWTFEFLKTYKSFLPEEAMENAYNYNLANYHLAVGSLDKAMHLLHRIDVSDIRYALATRAMQIRVYYELNEFEALINLSSTFKAFIKRNKQLNDARVNGFLNLLNLTLSCAKYKSRKAYQSKAKNQLALERISLKLNQSEQIINKSWITSKIQALIDQV